MLFKKILNVVLNFVTTQSNFLNQQDYCYKWWKLGTEIAFLNFLYCGFRNVNLIVNFFQVHWENFS